MTHITKSNCTSLFGLSRLAPRILSRATKLRLASTLSVLTLALTGFSAVRADGALVEWGNLQLTSLAPAPGGGFWVQQDTEQYDAFWEWAGTTLWKNGAPDVGSSVWKRGSIAAVPGRDGYFVVGYNGQIWAMGDTGENTVIPKDVNKNLMEFSGFIPGIAANWIVAAAAHPSGRGGWALGKDGAVWTWGHVSSYGDVKTEVVTGIYPVAIAATPSGNGYIIAMSDGGIHARGDAPFYASHPPTNGNPLTGIALYIGSDGKVQGYWMVDKAGGVFNCGAAPFWGSTGGNGSDITNIVSFPQAKWGEPPQRTRGYAWVSKYGNVTSVGEQPAPPPHQCTPFCNRS
jgi:hypothetical protein